MSFDSIRTPVSMKAACRLYFSSTGLPLDLISRRRPARSAVLDAHVDALPRQLQLHQVFWWWSLGRRRRRFERLRRLQLIPPLRVEVVLLFNSTLNTEARRQQIHHDDTER